MGLTAAAFVFFAVSAASADRKFRAVFHDRYEADKVTIAQGEGLTFENSDTDTHNLTSERNGKDGRPIFSTPNVTSGHSHALDRVTFLSHGSYKLQCTIDHFMRSRPVGHTDE